MRHDTEFCSLQTTLLLMPGSERVRLHRELPPMLNEGPLSDTLMAVFCKQRRGVRKRMARSATHRDEMRE